MTIGLWIGEAKTLRLTTHESTNDYEKTLILDIEKTAHNKFKSDYHMGGTFNGTCTYQ